MGSNDYEPRGSKRLRASRTLAENERLVIKFGSGQYYHARDTSYLLTVGYQRSSEKPIRYGRCLVTVSFFSGVAGIGVSNLFTVPPSVLSSWLEDLPLLQAITIWSGAALTQHAGKQIHSHCPDFKQLTIYAWYSSRLGIL